MYSITGRVGASQTGADGAMKLISAVDFMQDCSLFWMESEPELGRYFQEHHLALILSFRQADILRLPLFGENIRAVTSVYGCNSYYGFRNTVLYGANGAPCILSWSLGVFTDTDKGRMARLPQEVLDRLHLDDKLEMEYLDKKIQLPDTAAEPLPPVPVRRGDIDMNRHVNNVRYLEAAAELLPEGFTHTPARLRVEYKRPVKAGDAFYPERKTADDGRAFISLNDPSGKPCCVVEFTP